MDLNKSSDTHDNPLSKVSENEIDKALGVIDPEKPSPEDKVRAKTSLRMRYEAEVEVIRRKIGDIEDVRKALGLSRRKMCQLLMVDPSAWTRWSKDQSKVPPHIFRALQWYLALIEKQPEWHPQNAYLGAFKTSEEQVARLERRLKQQLQTTQPTASIENEKMEDSIKQLRVTTAEISDQLKSSVQSIEGWKIMLIANLAATGWIIISQFL